MELLQQKIAFIEANGDPITIIRSGGNVSTYARFVKGRQLLSPYEINFVRFMLFMPASGLQRGDLIQNATAGEQSFVAALQDRTLQGVASGVYVELYNVNYPLGCGRDAQVYHTYVLLDHYGSIYKPSAYRQLKDEEEEHIDPEVTELVSSPLPLPSSPTLPPPRPTLPTFPSIPIQLLGPSTAPLSHSLDFKFNIEMFHRFGNTVAAAFVFLDAHNGFSPIIDNLVIN